jgi:predicted small lipoprotein YifL
VRPRAGPVAAIAAAVLLACLAAGCGKKGPPLPPLRPVPARVATVDARVADGRVVLAFTVPAQNADGTTPAAVARLEIYRVGIDDASVTTPAGQVVQPDRLRGTLEVPRVDPDAPAPTPPAGTPAPLRPGDPATFAESLDPPAGASAPLAWRYVVVAVSGRDRRGAASPVITVPVGQVPTPPADVALTYDEAAWRLSWTPVEGRLYDVYDASADASPSSRLTPAPVTAGAFSLPLTVGARRCFVVRATTRTGTVSVESGPSSPACDTAVDRFPPPAPARLIATVDARVVSLDWTPVVSPDLAGYLVLRAGGADDTLRPLSTAIVIGTSYRDPTVTPGVAYTYAVVAVDRASNQSAASPPQTITVR